MLWIKIQHEKKELVTINKENSEKLLKCVNGPCLEFMLSMNELNLKLTCAQLKMRAGKRTRA